MWFSIISWLIKHILIRSQNPSSISLLFFVGALQYSLSSLPPWTILNHQNLHLEHSSLLFSAPRSDEDPLWMPYATYVFVAYHWNYCKDKWLWDCCFSFRLVDTTIFVLALTSQRILVSQNSSLEWRKMHCGSTSRLLSSLGFGEENFGGCNPEVFTWANLPLTHPRRPC